MKCTAAEVRGRRIRLPGNRVFSAQLYKPNGFGCLLKERSVVECYWSAGCDEAVVIGRDGTVAGVARRVKVKKGGKVIRSLGVNDLARDLGLTPAHVSQVLSGKRTSRRVSAAARGRIAFVGQEAS